MLQIKIKGAGGLILIEPAGFLREFHCNENVLINCEISPNFLRLTGIS
jgi:hypothetical protein